MSDLDVRTFVFTPPPVVSKRNQFSGAEELASNAFVQLPLPLQTSAMREFLLRFAEQVIRDVQHDFAVAAGRGIEQAANLLCDPAFYETRKQRREAWRKEYRRQQEQQEAERLERIHCPTAEQVAKELSNLDRWISEEETRVEQMKARREQLRALKPKNVRLMAPRPRP